MSARRLDLRDGIPLALSLRILRALAELPAADRRDVQAIAAAHRVTCRVVRWVRKGVGRRRLL